jgi:hypothetical protein
MRERLQPTRGLNRDEIEQAVASRRRFLASCALLAGTPFVGGCAVANMFHSSNPEADRRAADKATKDALKELEHEASLHSDKKLVVCFIGVTGGPNAANLSSATRELLEEGNFRLLEKNVVQAALKESGVSPNNVFIPKEREKFVSELGEEVDYFMAGYVEKQEDEDDEGEKSKKTVYKLDLVNVATNRKSEFVAEI